MAPSHRRTGIGAALTRALCAFALERRAVPYYGAAPSNVASMRTAQSAGMVLGWMEVTSVSAARLRAGHSSLGALVGNDPA